MPLADTAAPLLQRFAVNRTGRDLAVGDIHGCFSRLQEALRRVRFDPQRDRLFAVGDLVDRGPESHQVLEWLHQPWFHALCGNHDLMTWRRALGQPLAEVDHRAHGGQWLDHCDADTRGRLGRRLQQLPLALEVATEQGPVGLVHADFPYDDWQAMHDGRFSAEDEDTCLWSVARYRSGYTQPVRNVRALVHGHMTLRTMARLGNVFYIDTGGWREGGHFTLLDLKTLRVAR